jgi:hypothetical protein
MDGWQIAIGIFGLIIAATIPFMVIRYQRKQKSTDEKLRRHFEVLNKEVIDKISEMCRSLAIRDGRLKTTPTPIYETYGFERGEEYESFKLHFPNLAKEWASLNARAVKFDSDLVRFEQFHTGENARRKEEEDFVPSQRDFKNFAVQVHDIVRGIQDFSFGKDFKKQKGCPICEKF